MGDPVWVGLSDAVRGIRAELAEAMSGGEGSPVRFEVGPVEMEFAVDVRRDAKAGTGVRVWVLSADVGGGRSAATTHRLKVTLQPKRSGGGPLEITSFDDDER